MKQQFHLDDVVIKFSKLAADHYTIRKALQGIFILGAIGSGKSSGSGAHIAKSYLQNGFSGLVLTGKVGEREEWEQYARETGRSQDMIYFDIHSLYRFNPFAYEMSRTDDGGKNTANMRNLFLESTKLASRLRGGSTGSGNDPYWELALGRLIKAGFDILKYADRDVNIVNVSHLLRSIIIAEKLPQKFKVFVLEKKIIAQKEEIKVEDFHEEFDENYLMQCLYKIECKELDEDDLLVYQDAKSYFLKDFPEIPEKQRGSILEMYWSYAASFVAGTLAKFAGTSLSPDIIPENVFKEGKVIVLDFPVHTFGVVGIMLQSLYMKIWMDAVQRRKVDNYTIPAFLWIDECQFFLDSKTMLFQTTARSSRVASVFITQNISNLYATLGRKPYVDSLLGNLVTKIFHANNDYITNEWASRTIGKIKKSKARGTLDRIEKAEISEAWEDQVHPIEFMNLRNGGADRIVEAIISTISHTWSTGANFKKVKFQQGSKN